MYRIRRARECTFMRLFYAQELSVLVMQAIHLHPYRRGERSGKVQSQLVKWNRLSWNRRRRRCPELADRHVLLLLPLQNGATSHSHIDVNGNSALRSNQRGLLHRHGAGRDDGIKSRRTGMLAAAMHRNIPLYFICRSISALFMWGTSSASRRLLRRRSANILRSYLCSSPARRSVL